MENIGILSSSGKDQRQGREWGREEGGEKGLLEGWGAWCNQKELKVLEREEVQGLVGGKGMVALGEVIQEDSNPVRESLYHKNNFDE